MTDTVRLEIVTPAGTVYSEEVEMVTLPGVAGQLGIYPQHVPLITQMVPRKRDSARKRVCARSFRTRSTLRSTRRSLARSPNCASNDAVESDPGTGAFQPRRIATSALPVPVCWQWQPTGANTSA
jgi:hypothetical protein